MATASEIPGSQAPLVITRVFPAPPELVFRAWSSAEHLRHWFCPAPFTVPEACVEFRVGGAFDICMRSPDGRDHWTRGRFTEIVPHSRLGIDMTPEIERDRPLFCARTVVRFTKERGGTRLEVTQSYTLLDPAAAAMIAGAPMGWGQTLDRLALEVARMQKSEG